MHVVTYRDSQRGDVVHTATELSTILQRRLRYLAIWLVACQVLFTATVTAVYWRLILANPINVFTDPPLLGWLSVVALIAAFVAWQTAPGRKVELPRLRRLEALLFLPGFAVYGVMLSMILLEGLPTFSRSAGMLATGTSSVWIVAMFAYAVQIPNSWQRTAGIMAIIVLFALGPDVVILATHTVPMKSFIGIGISIGAG